MAMTVVEREKKRERIDGVETLGELPEELSVNFIGSVGEGEEEPGGPQ